MPNPDCIYHFNILSLLRITLFSQIKLINFSGDISKIIRFQQDMILQLILFPLVYNNNEKIITYVQ
jgi:hypothetical protein